MLEIGIEIVELEEKTYHPLVIAEFNGITGFWWVIDTGASKSVFDESLNEFYTLDNDDHVMATGLGKEMVETNSGKINSFVLGGTDFGVLQVALINFGHINTEYAKFSDKQIVGLLGSDFLYSHNAILDYGGKKLSLSVE